VHEAGRDGHAGGAGTIGTHSKDLDAHRDSDAPPPSGAAQGQVMRRPEQQCVARRGHRLTIHVLDGDRERHAQGAVETRCVSHANLGAAVGVEVSVPLSVRGRAAGCPPS
jgi:hypothetical protein